MQRVLVPYTASRATWVSALPSSAAIVEGNERKCPGKHAKGQEVLLYLACAYLHTGCSGSVISPHSLCAGQCFGVKGTVILAFKAYSMGGEVLQV